MVNCFMLKPNIKDIHDYLNNKNGLVVHFSGCPKGGGPGVKLYPNDLLQVISNNANGGVSCSLIVPGDSYNKSSAIGTVGLIIDFNSDGLKAVSPSDCGSDVIDGIRRAEEKGISLDDINNSLISRLNYNEWVIVPSKILGVFVFTGEDIIVWGDCQALDEHNDVADSYLFNKYIDIQQVSQDFINEDVFSFIDGSIAKLDRDSMEFVRVDGNEFYK